MDSTLVELGIAVLISIAIVVYGVLLSRGNLKAFSVLAGGGSFLALEPDDDAYRKMTRTSAAAVFLMAGALWCFVAGNLADWLPAVRAASLTAGVACVVAILAIVVWQFRLFVKVRSGSRG